MLVWITVMVLRISALLALILGILFWTETAGGVLVFIHMLLGIIVTLALWILGVAIAIPKGGSVGLGVGAIVLGLLVVALGLTQRTLLVGPQHWLIQVLHLLFGLASIGAGEMIGGRYRRVAAAKAA